MMRHTTRGSMQVTRSTQGPTCVKAAAVAGTLARGGHQPKRRRRRHAQTARAASRRCSAPSGRARAALPSPLVARRQSGATRRAAPRASR
eukprot:2569616-Pleurochrysis_carterae.AAC.2